MHRFGVRRAAARLPMVSVVALWLVAVVSAGAFASAPGQVSSIAVGQFPVRALFADGAVWVSNHHGDTVSRIDPATNTVVATIPSPGGPSGFAFGAGSVWVYGGNTPGLTRIDPEGNKALATIPLKQHVFDDPAFAAGGVWFVVEGGKLFKLAASTNRVSKRIRIDPVQARGLAYGANRLWGADSNERLFSVDPVRGRVRRYRSGCCASWPFAFGSGSVWVAGANGRSVLRFEPSSGRLLARIRVPVTGALGIAYGDAALWAAGGGTNSHLTLVRIDPTRNRVVQQVDLGAISLESGVVITLAYGAGSIWAVDPLGNRVLRYTPV